MKKTKKTKNLKAGKLKTQLKDSRKIIFELQTKLHLMSEAKDRIVNKFFVLGTALYTENKDHELFKVGENALFSDPEVEAFKEISEHKPEEHEPVKKQDAEEDAENKALKEITNRRKESIEENVKCEGFQEDLMNASNI